MISLNKKELPIREVIENDKKNDCGRGVESSRVGSCVNEKEYG